MMDENEKARQIAEKMLSGDAFSQWLGISITAISSGHCRLQMTVRPEMLNGFQIAHGAITFALADSALAFASNSRGKHALSIETSIAHLQALQSGEIITAEAIEEQLSARLARYRVEVRRHSDQEMVALFRGTVFRKDRDWA